MKSLNLCSKFVFFEICYLEQLVFGHLREVCNIVHRFAFRFSFFGDVRVLMYGFLYITNDGILKYIVFIEEYWILLILEGTGVYQVSSRFLKKQ